MEKAEEFDRAKVLHKLMRTGMWEHKHTSEENLVKGFPKHKRGDIRSIVDGLLKKGLLHAKPTRYGRQVSLNIDKKKEIEEIVFRYFGLEYGREV